jgi:nitrogen regulatory protein P-II 1
VPLKLVTAVLKPHVLDEVKDALRAAGVSGMTVTAAQGIGRQGGHTETYRGSEYTVDLLPKVRLEVVVDVFDAERVAHLIADTARSGKIGDGKVWITDVDEIIRIRTGETGAEAL